MHQQLRPISSSSILSSPISLSTEYYLAEIVFNKGYQDKTFLLKLEAEIRKDEYLKVEIKKEVYDSYICKVVLENPNAIEEPEDGSLDIVTILEQANMIADYVDRKKNNQMHPIARNLKAPAPPRFSQENDVEEFSISQDPYHINTFPLNTTHQVRVSHIDKVIFLLLKENV
jgi:hypothetical protein